MSNKNEAVKLISEYILSEDKTPIQLNKLAKAICEYLNITSCNDILTLIRNTNRISDKKFIAITLLRFYKNHESTIEEDKNLKRGFIQLFDEIYKDDLYPKLNIDKRTQNHEKLPLLIDYIENIEKQNFEIESLDKLGKFKQMFFKFIKGQYKDIITPFLEENILNDMNNVINFAELYINQPNLISYSNATKTLNEKISILTFQDSEYNNKFLLNPLKRILELIEINFNNNPDSKPSKLIITSNGKKYPLLSCDEKKFNLIVQIKNIEAGKAYNTRIKILDVSKNIQIPTKEQYLGKIEGNKLINVEFLTEIIENFKSMNLWVEVTWENYNQEMEYVKKKLTFYSQRTDIDWQKLENRDAYSIRAIETEDMLIGRSNVLDDLFKGLTTNLNSYYIHGQKRVGKTSIVKTLKSKLEKDKNFIVTYIVNTGSTIEQSIQNLGKRICKEIQRQHKEILKDIEIPIFENTIDPIEDYLDAVNDKLLNKKFVFILDEFDEMSSGLYERNDISNAFFLAIRNFASHDRLNCSFILVGGEKISFLMSIHGKHLNFFNEHRIDYFDKEHFNQFKELVTKPVSGYIEITDEAIEEIYNKTEGNPYFTNFICKEMLNTAIEKKDSHITDKEMRDAINKAISKAETHIFAHFWEDGIREFNDKQEEISYKRRSILLALASLEKADKQLKQCFIIDKLVEEFNKDEIKRILKEFVDRKILIENEDLYYFRIKFFKNWLVKYGTEKIIMTLTNEQKIQKRAKEEKDAKIDAIEIKKLIADKDIVYNGKNITTDDIRNWLEQFGDNLNQRLIFEILKNITYYRISNIKDKMKNIYNEIKKIKLIPTKSKKATHILVSYLDQIGKSGPEYAKYFIDENSIHSYNIVEKNKILDKLNSTDEIKILVFIDDFIGTGNTIVENIKELKHNYPEIFKKDIDIYIGIITGFLEAKENIEKELEALKISNIKIILMEPLTERDKCFSEASKIFTNPDKRREAKDLCESIGNQLLSSNPLGYGNCQATVIFPETCPNNCLPILWAKKNSFVPIFERKI
ncbi:MULTISPECIES: phosphoribosyltransferase-like protein [Aliarcobacter]|uniref:phosphoribosyltransferase-like protein n=1 Tax=Aliarcobacter TaxID=2321111 RepID=UPI00112F4970|nr:ATP-binding protein [Aliarcobacter cryaerophilus]QNM88252.1 ATP-binding protein [Aliarcobacter cryaerophilus]